MDSDPSSVVSASVMSASRAGTKDTAYSDLSQHAKDKRTWAQRRNEYSSPLFVDAEGMKEKIRQSLCKPAYHVTDLYKTSGVCQAVARSHRFENLTLCMVGLNAVWLAVDTDLNQAWSVNKSWYVIFPAMEQVFCVFFFLEWMIRFLAFEQKLEGFRDKWFLLDSVLLVFSVMDSWVLVLMTAFSTFEGSTGESATLRILRLLRLFRMARVTKLLKAMPELMILIRGMAAAMRSVLFTLCLLAMVIYVFSITITQLTQGTEVGRAYFAKMPDTAYTLLLRGTLLDNVEELVTEMRAETPFVALVFMLFVLVAALTVMNMLIGVLCEVVGAVAAGEKEEMTIQFVKQRLRGIIWGLDTDGDQVFSKTEFVALLQDAEAVKALQDVGVDAAGLVDFVDIIFESDEGRDSASMSFSRFLEVLLDFRGSHGATVKDLVNLRKYIRNANLELAKMLEHTNSKMDDLDDKLRKLSGQNSSSRRSLSRSRTASCLEKNLSRSSSAADLAPPRRLSADLASPLVSPQTPEVKGCGTSNMDPWSIGSSLDLTKVPVSTPTSSRPGDLGDGIQKAALRLEQELDSAFAELRRVLRELAQPSERTADACAARLVPKEVAPEARPTSGLRSAPTQDAVEPKEVFNAGRRSKPSVSFDDCQVADLDPDPLQ